MTLGFLVLRKGFLKVMGVTIQAALDRGHRVVLVWDPNEAKPGELVTEAELETWPRARRVVYRRGTPFWPVLEAEGIEALISPSLYYVIEATMAPEDVEAIGRAGIRLYSLDYSLETAISNPAGYGVIDTTFYVSEYQRQLHWTLLADQFAALAPGVDRIGRSAVCGSTMLDQLSVVDRAAVRKRYRLGPDQPVVLFMSLKMAVPDPWRRQVWGAAPRPWRALRALLSGHAAWTGEILRGQGYRELMESLRACCARTGAALVVKSREKNEDPPFVRDLADVFVYDERVYPYTSMELMAIASLCVHFDSGAVLEAAFAGVPSLSVAVSQAHLSGHAYFDELYGGRPGSMQNFSGVVWRMRPREAIEQLHRRSLGDFAIDPEARHRYVEKFQGFDDTHSSARVIDTIERAARTSPSEPEVVPPEPFP